MWMNHKKGQTKIKHKKYVIIFPINFYFDWKCQHNSPCQGSSHPDGHFQSRYITPGFKPSSYSSILSLGCLGHLKLLIKVTDMTAKIDGNILMTMSRKTKARKSLTHLLVWFILTLSRNTVSIVLLMCYAPVIWNPRTPPPIRAWAGHSLFVQVKVSEVPGSQGQKWVVYSLALLFNTWYSLSKTTYCQRNILVKRHCWQPWNKQIDLWAASK